MPKFNVHIYHTYRLRFDGIEAETPQAAAEIAKELPEDQSAITPQNDEGAAMGALVDTVGDTEFKESCYIDFPSPLQTRLVNALKTLHDACEYWEDQNDPVLKEAREALEAVSKTVIW